MTPSPNRNMQQRDMRPTAPMNPYRRFNQPGAQTNQNGQVSQTAIPQPTSAQPVNSSMPPDRSMDSQGNGRQGPAWGAPPPMGSTPASSLSAGQPMPISSAPSTMPPPPPENRYLSGPMGEMDSPPPMEQGGMMGAMTAPGMPAAARQQNSAPQPPGQPYARQAMQSQQQINRKQPPQMS